MSKARRLLPALAAFVFLAACSDGGGDGVVLTVTPAAATVAAGGEAVVFTATLSNSTATVTWSLEGLGTISTGAGGHSVTYSPPATVSGAATAILTASAGGAKATATVTITLPSSLTISGPATVTAGAAAVTYTATLTNGTATIFWSLSGQGSVSAPPAAPTTPPSGPTASYTPPATVSGTTTVTLSANAGGTTASVTITIQPAAAPALTISGPSSIAAGSAAVAYTATLTNSTAAISWSLAGPGSISPGQGTTTSYTPPATVSGATTATLGASAGGATATYTISIQSGSLPAITINGPSSVAAGGSPATYTASIAGGTGTITWSLSGPGSLSPATGIQTSYTPPASLPASTTATLTASATGVQSGTLEITILAGAIITVNGTVLDPNGQPVPNSTVIISGKSPVTTDASGRFTVAGVQAPYDCTSIWNIGFEKRALVHQGLTRPDPTLHWVDFGPVQPVNATITGRVTPYNGNAAPPRIAFGLPETWETDQLAAAPETTIGTPMPPPPAVPTRYDYSFAPDWYQASSTTGSLHALQWTATNDGLPNTYVGFASQPNVTISDGGTFNRPDLVLTNLSTTSINGSVSMFPNGRLDAKWVNVRFKSNALMRVLTHANSDLSFSYNTPNLSASVATLEVQTMASLLPNLEVSRARKRGLDPSASDVALVLYPPPVASLPVDLATGVTYTTDFRWTSFSNGIHVLRVRGPPTCPGFDILTKGTSARIPDLSAYGMELPAATDYTWCVRGHAPFKDVDAWAAAADPLFTRLQDGRSVFRQFTTQ